MDYLKREEVSDVRESKAPHNRSRTGYGSKLGTSWEVKLRKDNKWRRVYVIQWSNSGTSYIMVNKKPVYIESGFFR
jgi:hypothetical protein